MVLVLKTGELKSSISASIEMDPELTKKNIALFISSLDTGGAEYVISQIANYWVTNGHKVKVVTFDDPK